MDQLPFATGGDPLALAARYRELQLQAPVSRVRTPAGDTAWLICGYAEVQALTSDPRLGRSHPDPENAAKVSSSALQGSVRGDHDTERERHRRMRRLLAPAFSAKRTAQLRTRVAELVESILRTLPPPPVDLHALLSTPLPVMVICELLGAPYGDHPRLRDWSDRLASVTDPTASSAAYQEFLHYAGRLLDAKRRDPGEDVFSDLAQADEPPERAALMAMGLLFAGHETTMTRISLGTLLLLSHPAQREKLAADPTLAPGAVEEILRMTGSGASTGGIVRYAAADIAIGETTIPAGDAVLLAYVAANRDPKAVERPDEFDITRSPNPHLAFGHGPHFCLGASLARIELQEVFARLFTVLPTMCLDVPYEHLQTHTDHISGGVTALPVTW